MLVGDNTKISDEQKVDGCYSMKSTVATDGAESKPVKKQPSPRTARDGGVPSQKSSSRFEQRRFRRPPHAVSRAVATGAGSKKDEKVPSLSGGGRTEAEGVIAAEEEGTGIAGNGNAADASKITALTDANKSNSKPPKRRICKYFATEQSCYFGDRCRFLHIQTAEKKLESLRSASEQEPASVLSTDVPSRKIPFRPRTLQLTKEQLGSPEQLHIFDSEVAYFKRRFPGTVVTKSEKGAAIVFEYSVTDPEWIFDVKAMRFIFTLPQSYPVDKGCLSVGDDSLPKPLVIHLEKAFSEYLTARWKAFESKNAFESVGKSLIKWIDRSIFELFIAGLKKTKMIFEAENAGISLILPSAPSETTIPSTDTKFVGTNEGDGDLQSMHMEKKKDDAEIATMEDVEQQAGKDEEDKNNEIDELVPSEVFVADNTPSTTNETSATIDVRVQWNDLSANIASLSAASLAVSTKCVKCGALSFVTCVPHRIVTATCRRCSNRQSIYMKPELVHENSNVIARLDPKGCRPVDCVLLSSSFRFVCLNCNREATAENLGYGVAHKTWCFSCHTKCEFDISAIRFAGNFHLIAKEDEMMPKIKITKKKKPEQQIIIVDGEPLPDHGTCKHYKKSYRWLRFPCCGKLYPCDSCHDENELDHEMKFATRMVCGFCSKEQPFQKAKPCIRCSENVTRVKTSHWEGGKGCRDQNLMSRNDDRKYANSRMKTVSKKHAGQLQVKKKSPKDD
ncbi:Uncharacterized protein C18H10.09 [Toxocara canis]|uniref:Uncharacterized protein C18H10.09 n=1 Tax=Toxocara canis TaxID=6265 RepID=A0A0B2V1T3_TOXCA|nr:Uncharacterized protein C18H10.09 [Toxocara canis]